MTQKKQQLSWAMYDWANSAYSTSIVAGFFPAFFQQYWSIDTDPSLTTARLGLLSSLAGLMIAFAAPVLGSIADVNQNKKVFLFSFLLLGVGGTAGLSLVGQGEWQWASAVYIISFIGFFGANSFYDSLLPSAVGSDSPEYLSSLGYSLGYLGGGILLAVQVVALNMFGEKLGADFIVRASFVSVSFWWLIFALPLFFWVVEPRYKNQTPTATSNFKKSLIELKETLTEITYNRRHVLYFLIAYWLYIDGVYTIVGMAVNFGITLGFATSDLIAALLITQFVGFPSTWFFGRLSLKQNPRVLIVLGIGVYSLVTLWALFMSQVLEFYILAAVIGLAQGPVQSLSRGLFSHYIPVGRSAQYFGLFNLVGKFAAILGPLLVGVSTYFTGSARLGLISLLILFIPGALLLIHSGRKVSDLAK